MVPGGFPMRIGIGWVGRKVPDILSISTKVSADSGLPVAVDDEGVNLIVWCERDFDDLADAISAIEQIRPYLLRYCGAHPHSTFVKGLYSVSAMKLVDVTLHLLAENKKLRSERTLDQVERDQDEALFRATHPMSAGFGSQES
ncbi:hypothetical protein KW807_01725 [Candidatus Parcubacteria bacterium]|nr:hypothetical protein [Candidatus Parcubacteria bacterium]